jgi:hypothetical protein
MGKRIGEGFTSKRWLQFPMYFGDHTKVLQPIQLVPCQIEEPGIQKTHTSSGWIAVSPLPFLLTGRKSEVQNLNNDRPPTK